MDASPVGVSRVDDIGSIDRIALVNGPVDTTATSAHEFASRNADCLFVSIGKRTDERLRESAVAGVTDEKELLRAWRALFRQARSSMHAGATARDPWSHRVSRWPRHLHTPGAHNLAAQGLPMLPAAGWVEYEFDDLTGNGTNARS